MVGSAIYTLYIGLGYVATPVLNWLYGRRVAQGKEIVDRKGERFGKPGRSRPEGKLIWFHAASVGETNSVLPLIKSYAEQGHSVLFTSGTVTSAKIAQENLPKGAIHQFMPYDVKPIIKRFLEFWKPSAAVFVESEIWPASLHELEKRKIPTFLVNGRMSESSFQSWLRVRGMSKKLFGKIGLCFAQSELDAERFENLGVLRVESIGNLKFDIEPLDYNKNSFDEIVTQLTDRPRWLAVSTHPGEEEVILTAHKMMKEKYPRLLTMVMPRHPKRGQELVNLFEARNLKVNHRSNQQPIEDADEIYIVDTLGEVGLFCRLSDIVLLGGSFVNLGGHNPIEPAQLNCVILTGPHTDNNKKIFQAYFEANAALKVNSAEELANTIQELLNAPEKVAELADRATKIVESGRGALIRTKTKLDSELKRIGSEDIGGG